MSEWIYGKNSVKAALETSKRIQCLYVDDKNKDLVDLAIKQKIRYKMVTKPVLDKMVSGLHQGVVCEVLDYPLYELDIILREVHKEYPILVALDGIEDPHNLGAILRIADATGVDGILLPKNRSVGLSGTVAKVSTGAIEYVKVCEVTNLASTLEVLKKKGFWIVALELTQNAVSYTSMKYDMPLVLVVGSEGKGVSRLVLERSDFQVKLPMVGHVNSLNASVSCGIMLYEIIKYRKE
ncbi:MAG: 23S rRNA (guanosine(2251)-2'-O)-methyltransferase RlmB [Bacilli bacterium]|nr:23S rRNA (guanosine(2251)-2'-O)-methyltransferase RlmB [Bacilli bacterium]